MFAITPVRNLPFRAPAAAAAVNALGTGETNAPRPQAPAPAPAGDTLALGSHPFRRTRLVPGRDHLALTVQPGDTLSKLARRWGAPGGRSPSTMLAAIKQANGLAGDALKAGQRLAIPFDPKGCSVDLEMAIAVQKDAATRRRVGERVPAVDPASLSWHPGPLDTYLATANRLDGGGVQHYAIADDESDESGLTWSVRPISQAEYEKLSHGDLGEL
jgi:LysM repeat protein